MSTVKKTSVLVTVAEQHRDKLPQILTKLKKAGLEVGTVLEKFGRVQGMIEPAKMSSLQGVEGVEGVRPELTFTASRRRRMAQAPGRRRESPGAGAGCVPPPPAAAGM